MNILICYMHESELQMQSYDAKNKGTWIRDSRDLDELIPPEKSNRDEEDPGQGDPGDAWLFGLTRWWI